MSMKVKFFIIIIGKAKKILKKKSMILWQPCR